MKKLLVISLWFIIFLLLPATNYQPLTVSAIVDPLSVPNNKFGIHIIQATPDESSPAAQMVNNNGDWGYITFLIESKDRNHDKWQQFFDDLRRRHLIPLVRLATQPLDSHWTRPYDGEEQAWADFLDNLNWPTKNRYVIIYNEPNQDKEWGNSVDAKLYAETLDKTITALKTKNRDFFVLNAGLDASAPNNPPYLEDEVSFLKQMEDTVPGILNKLDGWVSHSYPNPGFVGSPDAFGRGTVRTWYWELQQLRNLGVTKNLPVFITEAGWRHAEGIDYDPSLPSSEVVADYYKNAFENAWSSERVVAVTPFLLSYQNLPFDHFSFKKYTGEKQKQRLVDNTPIVLGIQYPEYYPQYQILVDLAKVAGKPIQENKAQLAKGEIYSSLSSGQTYDISLTFLNTGQSIWNDSSTSSGQVVKLVAIYGGEEFGIEDVEIPKDLKIEPNKEYTFTFKIKAPYEGTHKISLNLFSDDKQFDSPPFIFSSTIKAPVILKIKANLKWKNSSQGEYILKIEGVTGETLQNISLSKGGESQDLETKYLLPDYSFTFVLERSFYKVKKITQKLTPGVNILDFGTLDPKLLSTILNPAQFWKLLPLSN